MRAKESFGACPRQPLLISVSLLSLLAAAHGATYSLAADFSRSKPTAVESHPFAAPRQEFPPTLAEQEPENKAVFSLLDRWCGPDRSQPTTSRKP